jgi:radical SAM protein with 4Fe4S-binding SPASM domain
MKILSSLKNKISKSDSLFKFTYIIQKETPNKIYKKIYNYRIKKVLKKNPKPKSIFIESFNVCNAKCIMCPYPTMSRKKEIMSLELFEKIVKDAKQEQIEKVWLHFYNEPMMDPKFFQRIEIIKKYNLKVAFYSNASLMTQEISNKLIDLGVDEIFFSVDGATKETYDKIRLGLNFETTRKNIIYLHQEKQKRKSVKPITAINFVIQKNNINEKDQLFDVWKPYINKIHFGYIDNRKDESNSIDKTPTKAFPCRRLWDGLQVTSSGKVALCCTDFDGKTVLGDLNTQTINEIWNSAKFTNIRRLHLNYQGDKIDACKDCNQLYKESSTSWWNKRESNS